MEEVATPSVPEMGPASPSASVRLSARELAELRAFAAGQRGQAIAQALGIGYRTVKRDIAGLQDRLDAPSMFVLGMRAVELGLASREELGLVPHEPCLPTGELPGGEPEPEPPIIRTKGDLGVCA